MKRCPTCDKTFDDAMRFCQVDGTPLVDAAEPVDPYKTMVARPGDIASAIPPKAAEPPKPESDDLLQIPNPQDSLKTMYASEDEIRREMANDSVEEQVIEIPPMPASQPPSFERQDKGGFDPNAIAPPPSPFSVPEASKPGSSGRANDPMQSTNPPIPSPFSEPKPAVKESSPFDEPKPAASVPPPVIEDRKEPEPVFQQSPGSPFDEPSSAAAWNPPPVPDSNWQNTPVVPSPSYSPAGVGAAGPSQTLAIVSLALGIISVLLCQITGPVAVVVGLMARRKATQNPAQYTGAGFALGGIITGLIGTLLLVLAVIYLIFVFGMVATQNF